MMRKIKKKTLKAETDAVFGNPIALKGRGTVRDVRRRRSWQRRMTGEVQNERGEKAKRTISW